MHSDSRRLMLLGFLVCLAGSLLAEDVVELNSGAKSRGMLISVDDKEVVMSVRIGNQTLTRKYPKDRVAAIVRNGKREEFQSATPSISKSTPKSSKPAATPPSTTAVAGDQKTKAEVQAEIDRVGRTPPAWYDATPLNYPQSLDLSWPQPPQGGWDNQKNVGQFIWDVINPNPSRWREGVKLLHHVLSVTKDPVVQRRAMNSLAVMYHNLHGDYARAAFWWQQAKVETSGEYPGSQIHLAECYWRLGSKSMAVELLSKLTRVHPAIVKLYADMGDKAKALKTSEIFARSSPDIAWMDAGDACRIAEDFDEALAYYEKVLNVPAKDPGKGRIERNHRRAQASIDAIKYFEKLDLQSVPNGKFTASSLGYEGQVQVEVSVSGKKITDVRITQHREKQFYSALTETPARIIAKQGVKGVDTTSGATLTSEAIINATAKALAGAK